MELPQFDFMANKLAWMGELKIPCQLYSGGIGN